ncbi:site-2 protease family protein [Petrotoga sp. 9PWA.NaAc.5.4]|uniref:site-2 protease family protein n=1 Tax=Petrotoga sp. 9PWA.NaAc.5.4 TaxID=1434328 RepID=UPI000CBFBBB7|nr:site-2 protease family protein [Petrotoga sp. 9PWA.NaAc.5.4]PNR92832.1 peptidase [Petrotoga sp. 9PWA.NaAc.5.4]
MTVVLSIIWFLIIISVIALVHEFGHFIFAKIFKTKVEEFAVGFGPSIFKIPGKETIFRFNAIPLGGYVRLAGEEEIIEGGYSNNDPTLFYNKKPWQKFLITFAGPLFSFLLGYFIFIGIAGVYGFPEVIVERVGRESVASEAGLMPGDVIKKVNGNYVFNPAVLEMEIMSGKNLDLTVIRNGEELNVTLIPKLTEQRAIILLSNVQGVNDTSIKSSRILTLNGEEEIYEVMGRMEIGDPIEIQFEDGTIVKGSLLRYTYVAPTYETGIIYSTFSNVISKGSGVFQEGDKILEINGVTIENGSDLQNVVYRIQLNPDQLMFSISEKEIINEYKPFDDNYLNVLIERNNERFEITISKTDFLDFILKPGVLKSAYENWRPKGIEALTVPVQWANNMIALTFQSFVQLFTGRLSADQLAGPVGAAAIIGQAAEVGLEAILNLMALITISLGVFNLIPIPGLDGGRIVFSIYEMITRKRVSPKVEAIVNTIGFLFLIFLMIFVTYNDIMRFFR